MTKIYPLVFASILLFGTATSSAFAQGAKGEGITPTSILLGTTTPLTGPVGPPCKPISDGSLAWFKEVNEKGGVNGRKIENIVLDDAYKAPEALANGRELAGKPVFAFFGGCGTLQPPVLISIARQNGLLYLFPFAGNPELQTTKFVYNLFPLYGDQYGSISSAAMSKHGAGSLYLVVADVPGVDDTIASVKKAVEGAGGKLLGTERITQQESDYTPLALKIKAAAPDYVAFHTTAPASARLIKAMHAQDAFPKKFLLAAATQAVPSFLQSVVGLVDGKLLTALPVAPVSSERSKTCLDVLKKHAPDVAPDVFSLFGCAIAQVFTTALADTPEPVTRAKLAATLEGWKDKNASPLFPALSFGNPKHLGLNDMILAGTEGGQPVLQGEITLAPR